MTKPESAATRAAARQLFDLRCAQCGKFVPIGGSGINIGNMQYHERCAPHCATCGRTLHNAEVGWVVQGEVMSVAWGYSVRPIRLWCAACLESAPRDEPAALD